MARRFSILLLKGSNIRGPEGHATKLSTGFSNDILGLEYEMRMHHCTMWVLHVPALVSRAAQRTGLSGAHYVKLSIDSWSPLHFPILLFDYQGSMILDVLGHLRSVINSDSVKA
ncbi:hypothetical protein PC9H_001409 [Pleurotus ostreatus]|uniref:Uncharacterized protein n=2 Tax=Pleurotus ostreatus TaxID=5322 RepID=A0A067P0P5_PLEO1|nr:uncharacterized protein PC9H_001409 [Pleurotus ostreatus]KAF7441060.1 hypothetical protein PC9H_001409 [Pleurotus ostreatus]KDQ33873.1 hypothetical protein PLEOSDRAFT_152480 [Pleurotus ostreatus PC15]